MNIGEPPSFDRSEKTQITEIPKLDDFKDSVVSIRKALKERPTEKGYLTLIGILLDKCLQLDVEDEALETTLDEADETTKEYSRWKSQRDK